MAYIIQPGDTLSGIAAKNGTTVDALVKLNPTITDPNLIRAGASLNLAPVAAPAPAAPAAPAVQPGTQPIAPGTDKGVAYRYEDDPTVRRSTDDYAFSSMDELIKSGIDPTQIKTIKRGTQVTDPNSDIAKKIGAAGGSATDLQNLMGTSSEEAARTRKDLGIDQLEQTAFQPPSKSTEQFYNDAYAAAGLADAKKKISDLLTEINNDQQKFNEGIATVNENPWLSEASRVGRVKRATDQFNAQIQTKVDRVKSLGDLYNNGVAEVNALVTRQGNDFTTNQNLNASKLDYLLKKAETIDKQNAQEKLYKYLPDYLQSKISNTKPETIGDSSTGIYKWDATKGTFVQVVAPSKNFSFEKTDNGNFLLDPKTGDIQTIQNVPAGSLISAKPDPSKIIANYDLTTYATDPQHGVKVSGVYTNLPDITDAASADAAIKKLNPNSPVSGADVMAAAQKYAVDPKLIISIMKVDSQLGTAGKGAKTFNPGNVGNTDSGATVNYGSWTKGVEAVAQNLSKRNLNLIPSTNNFGALSAADKTKATNWLLTQPHTQDDLDKLQTDREFQAWAIKQATLAGF